MSFRLALNDFQENIQLTLKESRNNEDFTDVTLVSEDERIEAHRVILAASSSFFSSVFLKTKHPHPMIYMKGVKHNHLLALLDFIYTGEANIPEDELNQFLALAEELQLKGLKTEGEKEAECEANTLVKKQNKKQETRRRQVTIESLNEPTQNKEALEQSLKYDSSIPSPLNNFSKITVKDEEELNEAIKLIMVIGVGVYSCKLCGKSSDKKHNMLQHIESNHMQGLAFPCSRCDKSCKTRRALQQHVLHEHKQ